jgi:hypothetical protein
MKIEICLCGDCVGDGFDMFPHTGPPKPTPLSYPYPSEQESTVEDTDFEGEDLD